MVFFGSKSRLLARYHSVMVDPKRHQDINAASSITQTVTNALHNLTPFHFKKDQIDIIETPAEFYRQLKHKISTAEKRIFLASLYIGKSQDELINCISEALRSKPDLKVDVLTDGLRGTREAPAATTASLLARLVQEHGDERVNIRLYRSPEFSGWKTMIPKRFNEGVGLQHMKIYGFDDEVILSGANLSTDYFTDRQDRYYLFKCKEFTDYYHSLQQLIGKMSYKVSYSDNAQKFKMLWPSDNVSSVPPQVDRKQFIRDTSVALKEFLNYKKDTKNVDFNEYPTAVYPVSQFTPLFERNHDLSTEKPSILSLISSTSHPDVKWTFTAGYFNMLPDIKHLLMQSQSPGTVITASPLANGFYKSGGVSRHLPNAYLYLANKFLKDVQQKHCNISLMEWKKGIVNTPGGWSYHAKGIWITDYKDHRPCVTVIGSSNYTKRAYSLDLESNAIIVTKDEALRDKMRHEVDKLMANSKQLNLEDFRERPIPLGVKIATNVLGGRL